MSSAKLSPQLTLTQALSLVKSEKDVRALTALIEKKIDLDNQELNLFLSRNNQLAKDQNKSFNTPLKGLPFGVKDNFCTTNLPTTASSKVLEGFVPAYDATVISKLRSAGGVIQGKLNMDAWAHGSSTETSAFGPSKNPRNKDYSPGGSSGGSAAAVAGDYALAALGSETGGSIRGPAAWCGVVGLKPSYGRVSRRGVVAMASSTDSPGLLTKTTEDAALLLSIIAGHDELDATSSKQTVPDYTSFLNQDLSGLKIGVLYDHFFAGQEPYELFKQQLPELEKLGASVEFATALDPHYSVSVYTILQRAEVSSNLARYDGVRYGQDRSFFGDEAKRRILLGTFTLSSGYADQYYHTAEQVKQMIMADYDRLFEQYDALISLSMPGFADKVGASQDSSMHGELADMLNEPSCIAGLPGISVPCYRDPDTNLFLGMNIVAPYLREDTILKIADAYERATSWNTWRGAA